MNLVDLIVLAVIAVSALLGLSRGFVREILGLGSWLLAGYGALRFGPALLPFMNRTLDNPDIAGIAAYGTAFILLLIVLSLLSNMVGSVVRVSALGGLDRTLGLLFGMARGAIVLIAAYILGGVVLPHAESWPPQIRQARTIPLLYDGAFWASGFLPPQYRPTIAAPPGDTTTSADLLQVSPEGRALGPRLPRN